MFFRKKKFSLDKVDVNPPKKYTAEVTQATYAFPKRVDFRDMCLPTDNQGDTPHCVGFSVAGYLEVKYWQQFHKPCQFPAHDIYNEAKKIDGDSEDGSTIENGFEGAKKLGLFTGSIKTFEPWTLNVRFQLHKYGIFSGAFMITDEWYNVSSRTGMIKPSKNPEVLGGHAVLVCGYNENGIFIQNSWGYKEWGKYGFAILPWSMVPLQLVYGVVIDNIKLANLQVTPVSQE